MTLNKKILLILMPLVVVLCFGTIAEAKIDFHMRIDTVTVPEGYEGEVTVPVYLETIPLSMELSCFAWEFYFDSDSITLINNYEAADFAGELIVNPDDCSIGKYDKVDGSMGKFRFGWTSTRDYITQPGVALNLKFQVPGDLAPGVYNIVADPYSDIRSGVASVIYTDDLFVDLNSYLTFGAIIVEGESDYNDYDLVSSKAKFPYYVPEDAYFPSDEGDADDTYSTTSGSSTGVISSSSYRPMHTNDYDNDNKTVADTFDAGTMIAFAGDHIVFDTIKSQTGYLVCLLYKGEDLVGYDISWAIAGEKTSANIYYTDIPDKAVSVIMRSDGTFDCHGKYPIYKD